MPREYRHIKMYEKEIFELREQGLSQRQIAEKLGFPYEKMRDFFRRHNLNQRKASSGEGLKRQGRPKKEGTFRILSKVKTTIYFLSIDGGLFGGDGGI